LKNVAIFGGTFDPIHVGHIQLALEMCEQEKIDEVWFVPARQNPFKEESDHLPVERRLAMVELAIEGISQLKLCTIEAERKGVSYTIDTVEALTKKWEGEIVFSLLIGSDSVKDFFQWKDAEKILEMATVYIGLRTCSDPFEEIKGPNESIEKLKGNLLKNRVLEISSTYLRQSVREGKPWEHLVPRNLIDYIVKNRLYLPV